MKLFDKLLTTFICITCSTNILLAAPFAYVANSGILGSGTTVTIFDTATNSIITTVTVGTNPINVAVTPDGSKVYVTNGVSDNVSVIQTSTNTVIATITVGDAPFGIAVLPNGSKVYVSNSLANTVNIIDTATDTVTKTINVGTEPAGIAISPDGTRVLVANNGSNNITAINAIKETPYAAINVGEGPEFIAISPNGATAYVTNSTSNSVSVIDIATSAVTATITTDIGLDPIGIAITPDGSKVYVANNAANAGLTCSFINTSTNLASPIAPGFTGPFGIAVTPDGSKAFVTNRQAGNVVFINTSTDSAVPVVAIPGFNAPEGIAITPTAPPKDLRGFQEKNKFSDQRDLINVLTWNNPNNPNAVEPFYYIIAKDQALTQILGYADATPAPPRFEVHNRKKGKTYTYWIATVGVDESVSTPRSVTINP